MSRVTELLWQGPDTNTETPRQGMCLPVGESTVPKGALLDVWYTFKGQTRKRNKTIRYSTFELFLISLTESITVLTDVLANSFPSQPMREEKKAPSIVSH